ncbi:MAG: hypothetical protein JNM55_12280 [Anaerolineales bacterium]|nr:hypothetical protein [Anaerolineales bacterium]
MKPKYKKERSHTPAWLDSLITVLEIIGMIGTFLAGLYSLVSWVME